MPFLERFVQITGHGERQGSLTAVQMATRECQGVRFRALLANTGNIYLGKSSSVTVPQGTTNSTTGIEVGPGEYSPHFACYNLDEFWVIFTVAADKLTYFLY